MMSLSDKKLTLLRQRITEGLRIQRDTGDVVPYIDTAHVVGDVTRMRENALTPLFKSIIGKIADSYRLFKL
jgi:hypothetical protein